MLNDTESTSSTDPLTESWIAFVEAPDDASAQNRFAAELHVQARKFLPRGVVMTPFKELSDDICQEACLLLFAKLLAGNRELVAATGAGHRAAMAGQLRRSVSAALRFSRWKLIKNHIRHSDLTHSDEERQEVAYSQHPANFTTLSQLSLEAQHRLVMDMLIKAVRELHIAPVNAALARSLLENNLTQADLAKSLGVTRQALHQRLQPVWRFLRKAIDDHEFPLS